MPGGVLGSVVLVRCGGEGFSMDLPHIFDKLVQPGYSILLRFRAQDCDEEIC